MPLRISYLWNSLCSHVTLHSCNFDPGHSDPANERHSEVATMRHATLVWFWPWSFGPRKRAAFRSSYYASCKLVLQRETQVLAHRHILIFLPFPGADIFSDDQAGGPVSQDSYDLKTGDVSGRPLYPQSLLFTSPLHFNLGGAQIKCFSTTGIHQSGKGWKRTNGRSYVQ